MKEIILEAENLTKVYQRTYALKNFDLALQKGEIYGLVGPNGAGKTTFMKLINNQIQPTEGKITLFGEQSFDRVGSLIETPGLYLNATAEQNILYKCSYLGIHRENYAQKLLAMVGLADVGKKKVKKFSLGMKQRLGIALALVGDPDLLILDEPINGMDPAGIRDFREMMLRLNDEYEMTMIISSHLLDELAKFATRFGFMNHGMLLKDITKQELEAISQDCLVIKTTTPEKITPVLEEALNIQNYQVTGQDQIQIYDTSVSAKEVSAVLGKENLPIESLFWQKQTIESYYMNVVGGNLHA